MNIFINVIHSPEYLFLGVETDFCEKRAPLYVLRVPKYPKIDQNPNVGLFLAYFWPIFGKFDPLIYNMFLFLLQFLKELIDSVILSHQPAHSH